MMKSGKCNCPHHMVAKILGFLVWVAGVLFFWSSIAGSTIMGMAASYWAWAVVVLFLMAKSMHHMCSCCCGDKHCNMCAVDSGKQM